MLFKYFLPIFLVSTFFLGCAQSPHKLKYPGSNETERINFYFEKAFQGFVSRHPEMQTYLGLKTGKDQLDDRSEAFAKEEFELAKSLLSELEQFDRGELKSQAQLSYDLFKLELENQIAAWEWRHHNYPVDHMRGVHSSLPSFMMNMHKVEKLADVESYVARLNQFDRVFTQVIDQMKTSEKAGVIPPKFVFVKVLSSARNVLTGRPFKKSNVDSPLLKDFKTKLKSVKGLKKGKQSYYEQKATMALQKSVKVAYEKFIAFVQDQEKRATTDDGAWKLPQGKDYYRYRLKKITTTDYDADFIHRLGKLNVDRIHGEMRKIMKQVGFKGNLKEFFKYASENKKFYYSQNKKGRGQYLKLANGYIAGMNKQLDGLFNTKPKAKLEVKAVEDYREKAAGTAFYEGAAIDGSRPGTYYVNLSNLKALPTWEAESLAYHEAIPGHHMQISIAQEMDSLPQFRRHGHFTAYVEGWALYAERVPKEIGMYKDPYSDFGRLSNELYRAARLVVDTGIHAKKWPRAQAVEYMDKNTPSDHKENYRQIDRYTVWPGQATAYMVGMLKILELRRRAKTALGGKFDLRAFHDVILLNGAVPLDILESLVSNYVKSQGGTLSQPAAEGETRS